MFFFNCFKEQKKTMKTRKQSYTFSDINKCAHHLWRKLELHFLSLILLFKNQKILCFASRKCFMDVKNCHTLTELYGFNSKVGTFNIDCFQYNVSQVFRYCKLMRFLINNKTWMFNFKTWKPFSLKGNMWATKGCSLYVLISTSKLLFTSYSMLGWFLPHSPRATLELRAENNWQDSSWFPGQEHLHSLVRTHNLHFTYYFSYLSGRIIKTLELNLRELLIFSLDNLQLN